MPKDKATFTSSNPNAKVPEMMGSSSIHKIADGRMDPKMVGADVDPASMVIPKAEVMMGRNKLSKVDPNEKMED